MPRYYKAISSCVTYDAYSFTFPVGYTVEQHHKLYGFINQLGKNTNPAFIKVLHILHPDFFIDFPAHGFPSFKVSFYRHVTVNTQKNYLRLLNHQLLLSTMT